MFVMALSLRIFQSLQRAFLFRDIAISIRGEVCQVFTKLSP